MFRFNLFWSWNISLMRQSWMFSKPSWMSRSQATHCFEFMCDRIRRAANIWEQVVPLQHQQLILDSGLWCLCARISWRKGDLGRTGGRIAKEVYAHVESRRILRVDKSKVEEIPGRQMHHHASVALGSLNNTNTFPLKSSKKQNWHFPRQTCL